MSEQNNLSEEDYLRKHLEGIETKSQPQQQKQEIRQDQPTRVENSRISDLHYFAFDAKSFPCGMFYPSGATIQIRAAEVKEVQAYSMVDDTNFYDIVEKMNEILASCVRVKYLDGKIGSYLDIRDPDRYFLIFLIRELTFQQGSSLTAPPVGCSCGNDVQIELKRENFKFYKIDEKIEKYFDFGTSSFRFKIKGNRVFNLAPPTIGLQKSFTDYIIKENAEKRKPNLSFLKIIPFLLYDRTSITLEGIKTKLEEYQKMDDVSFQFLNSAVEKMTFGIEQLKKKCSLCGLEVHTEMIFPNGASGIFVIPNAFDEFIEE